MPGLILLLLLHSLCSPTANKNRIRDAYKRLIVLNHPDRGTKLEDRLVRSLIILYLGGSAYVAAKINEAKDFLETSAK